MRNRKTYLAIVRKLIELIVWLLLVLYVRNVVVTIIGLIGVTVSIFAVVSLADEIWW